ncbi:MAG: hypothetical protein ACTSPD_13135 [Promethearchaeota archaeon]
MKLKERFKKVINTFKKKIKEFFKDEYGGNLVEYALLIGFALFVFFLIVGIVTSILDWTVNQSNEFFNLIGNIGD